jgi:tetratricopeptide (TPR) repeat protein
VTEEKKTIPPSADYDTDMEGEDELSVMKNIPEELLESVRDPGVIGREPPAVAREPGASEGGGLKQMFSRDPEPIRHVLPNESEGDALLEILFDDAKRGAETPEAPAAVPPPLPAPPRRPPPPRPAAGMPPPRPVAAFSSADDELAKTRVADPVHEARVVIDEDQARASDVRAELETLDAIATSEAAPIEEIAEPVDAVEEAVAAPEIAPEPEEGLEPVDLSEEPLAEAAPELPRPTPIPSRPPPAPEFPHERDASARLASTHDLDGWTARAAWLREEAEALDDRDARARALLVVSELYAMAGEEPLARTVAAEARELSPSSPLAHRQARGLAARDAGWASVLEAVDAETRVMATPVARCHGAMLGAEIARLATGDAEASHKRIELSTRANPNDPRAHVHRLAEQLASGAGDALSKARLPDAPELAPLAAAWAQVLAHRGVAQASSEPASAYERLLRVRSALASGDVKTATATLARLREDEGLRGGAGWLGAALAAPSKATRAEAVDALREVTGGSHGPLARRALAARAIELGDAAAARAATEAADTAAFSPIDRVVLAALTGGAIDDARPWISACENDPETKAVAAAASAVLTDPARSDRDLVAVGQPDGQASVTLGRALAAAAGAPDAAAALDARHALARAVHALSELDEASGVARALSLELDLVSGDAARVAEKIAGWRGSESEAEAEVSIAAAVLTEAAGERDAADRAWSRVLEAEPTNVAATRARAAQATPAEAARLVAELAQASAEGPQAALLLGEAALRLSDAGDADAADPLLRRAVDMEPKLPFAVDLAQRAARMKGDRDGLLEWLRARRDASADPIDRAHDLVREALLLSDSDATAAGALLEEALRGRPADVGLRELYERLAPERPADAAAWREARANEAQGSEAARLALEAALEHERDGDLERAAACARRAVELGDTELAPIATYRLALRGHGAGDLVDSLLPLAREATDPVDRREIYERLAELDERGRGDVGSGLLFRRTILEETPGHLPTLRRVASALIAEGRDDELEPIALETAKATDGTESVAHATVSARLRLRASGWDETLEPVQLAYGRVPRGLWVLRQMAAHGRARGEFALAREAEQQLAERMERPHEAATLLLRAAQSARRAGDDEGARALLERAAEAAPEHVLVHLELAAVLESAGEHALAAARLEEAANVSALPAERQLSAYRAAVLWLEKVGDASRGRQALEAVAEIDPSYEDVFARLQAIYVAEGARAELASLLERRLDVVSDPGERVEMEVLRGRALAEVGDHATAKRALAAALEANPDHVDALSAFADLCAAEEDWTGAEQAWIRLARLVPDASRQAAIYLRLGELYDERVPNPERAELAYGEILKRSPSDTLARERLVALYKRGGDTARALEQQNLLIGAAEAPEAKCQRTVELAEIHEAAGDAKKAEATLIAARKAYPKDERALSALARFYLRTGQGPAAHVLLDRAVADARRALGTGRFEPYLFETVASVAELRGRPDAALVAKAVVAALDGQDAPVPGAGASAGQPALDELLAPEVVTPAFRELLGRTGALLDGALPYDLGAIRATPLPPQQAALGDEIRTLAAAYALPGIQIQVSSVLGPTCLAVSSHPPTLVLGQALLTTPREDVRTFLIHRALKVIQTNTCVFARTAPIDLWPLLAAYLKAFATSFAPQGVDAAKLTDAYGRLKRVMPAQVDPQLGVLAADVIGSIGNRASTLNTAVNGWGARAGLLAVGDPNVALSGIAWAGGHTNQPPASGKERVTWIGRNAEARELVVFSVSDAYADARGRLGV